VRTASASASNIVDLIWVVIALPYSSAGNPNAVRREAAVLRLTPRSGSSGHVPQGAEELSRLAPTCPQRFHGNAFLMAAAAGYDTEQRVSGSAY
jgi:hypothetical protein